MSGEEAILQKLDDLATAIRLEGQAPRQAAFTLPAAALYLGLRKKTTGEPNVSAVRELCRQRKVPFSKPGKYILIKRADLDRMLDRTRVVHPLKTVGT